MHHITIISSYHRLYDSILYTTASDIHKRRFWYSLFFIALELPKMSNRDKTEGQKCRHTSPPNSAYRVVGRNIMYRYRSKSVLTASVSGTGCLRRSVTPNNGKSTPSKQVRLTTGWMNCTRNE